MCRSTSAWTRSSSPDWGFECSEPIHYGSYGTESLDLWYAKGETRDLMPENGAWPRITGQYRRQGVDYFTDKVDLEAAGKFTFTSHLFDHYLGGTPNHTRLTQRRGRKRSPARPWASRSRAMVVRFHESGDQVQTATVTDQTPDAEVVVDGRPRVARQPDGRCRGALRLLGFEAVIAP